MMLTAHRNLLNSRHKAPGMWAGHNSSIGFAARAQDSGFLDHFNALLVLTIYARLEKTQHSAQ